MTKRKRAVSEYPDEYPNASEDDEPERASQTKRFRSSFANTITVLAVDDKVPFTVHTETLRAKSDFFVKACQREWIKRQDKTVKLPEVEPETFELYATWSYFDKIDLEALRLVKAGEANHLRRHEETQEQREVWASGTRSLMHLYVAADFLGDKELKKRTIDCLTEIVETRHQLHGLRGLLLFVWKSTPPGSGLRTLLLDYIVSYRDSIHQWVKGLEGVMSADFFVDLALHQLKRNKCFDNTRHKPLPGRKHMYYDGYESDA
ncbi:hypothetical protein LTR56_003103 [Elasticomyces elasticus]|nr:hypothetical protein LTR56_003103 [Elasticomyces elasticus]